MQRHIASIWDKGTKKMRSKTEDAVITIIETYFLRLKKSRNALPQCTVTRSLGSILRMATRRLVSTKGLRQVSSARAHGGQAMDHGRAWRGRPSVGTGHREGICRKQTSTIKRSLLFWNGGSTSSKSVHLPIEYKLTLTFFFSFPTIDFDHCAGSEIGIQGSFTEFNLGDSRVSQFVKIFVQIRGKMQQFKLLRWEKQEKKKKYLYTFLSHLFVRKRKCLSFWWQSNCEDWKF